MPCSGVQEIRGVSVSKETSRFVMSLKSGTYSTAQSSVPVELSAAGRGKGFNVIGSPPCKCQFNPPGFAWKRLGRRKGKKSIANQQHVQKLIV
jgi:hypothetical protein